MVLAVNRDGVCGKNEFDADRSRDSVFFLGLKILRSRCAFGERQNPENHEEDFLIHVFRKAGAHPDGESRRVPLGFETQAAPGPYVEIQFRTI